MAFMYVSEILTNMTTRVNHTGKLKKVHDLIVRVHWSMIKIVILGIHFAEKYE